MPRPNVPYDEDEADSKRSWSVFSLRQHQRAMGSLPTGKAEEIGYALKSYNVWCSMTGLPDKERWPITTVLLRVFLASFLGVYKVDTVKKKVRGLRDYSHYASIAWKVKEDELAWLYATIKAAQPHPKLKRPPLLAQHIKRIVEIVKQRGGLKDNYELAMLSLTLVGFGGAMRSGEVTVSKNEPGEVEWSRKVKLSGISKTSEGQLVVTLPWDKANGANGRKVPIVGYDLDTPAIFEKHLQQNKIQKDDFPFSFRSTKGSLEGTLVPITKLKWTRWLGKILDELKLKDIKGHSLRIGGATQLLLNGFDPAVVKAVGGWKSDDSFMKYWRHADALIKTGQVGPGKEIPEEDLEEAFVSCLFLGLFALD